ncbi:flagellar biosynthesis protein FlhB [Brevundimonas denitrificans]|uniref:flagellar biosynthesis protein FlhB n=1 Tax=Brevundimonas denitrificans TaxID=1443434 RepID=UPI00223A901E|nr:flagellar biosynthesis protein FlhB [Brevundimonas denitrificans]
MAEEKDQESKTEEATPRKLDEARKRRRAKTPDLASWLSLMGASAVILIGGGWFTSRMAAELMPFLAQPHAMVDALHAGAGIEIGTRALWATVPLLGAIALATIVGGAGGNLAQSGFLFTGEKIKPKLEKISPLKGAKRIFGPDGLMQFVKTFLKLVAIVAIAWVVLKPHTREMEAMAAMSPAAILPMARDLAVAILGATLAFLGVAAFADFLWQRHRFARRMRMTREELKDDYKQAEGDPHVKAKLKQIRAQKGRQRMMQNVPNATVIVTNPTHYSVALKYEPGEDAAPLCVAKGVDALALKIREVAREHEVPIIEDVPLARALYATVEVDEVIPREHFEAAAKVIGFVLNSRKRR